MSATIFFLLLILIIVVYFTSKKVFRFLLSKKIDKICKQYVSKTLDYKPYTTFHSNLILLNNFILNHLPLIYQILKILSYFQDYLLLFVLF